MTPYALKVSQGALKYACSICGGQSALSRTIKVSQPSLYHWTQGNFPIGAEWVIPIEKATKGKVTRYQLRPDLYPEEK